MFLCSGSNNSAAVDVREDPKRNNKKKKKKQQCVSKQTVQLYTESSNTLSPHTMRSSGDDRPGMEFNFTSLFPFSSLSFVTHRQDTHIWFTPAHIQRGNLRLEKATLENMAFRNDKNREKQLSEASHIRGVCVETAQQFSLESPLAG